jgi:hypothetical protein
MTAAICYDRNAWTPSGVIFWPIDLADKSDTRPPASWTFRGRLLPHVQEDNDSVEPIPPQESGQPRAYTPIYLRHLRDVRAVERATIPVENIRVPILLVSGTDDQMRRRRFLLTFRCTVSSQMISRRQMLQFLEAAAGDRR